MSADTPRIHAFCLKTQSATTVVLQVKDQHIKATILSRSVTVDVELFSLFWRQDAINRRYLVDTMPNSPGWHYCMLNSSNAQLTKHFQPVFRINTLQMHIFSVMYVLFGVYMWRPRYLLCLMHSVPGMCVLTVLHYFYLWCCCLRLCYT